MRILICVFMALAVSACSSSATKNSTLKLGTSSTDVRVTCRMGWSECDDKAREYCGGDYEEVREPGPIGGRSQVGGAGADARTQEVYRRATSAGRSVRSMTIRCK